MPEENVPPAPVRMPRNIAAAIQFIQGLRHGLRGFQIDRVLGLRTVDRNDLDTVDDFYLDQLRYVSTPSALWRNDGLG